MTIDNGNHLLLSGNRAALDYLRDIGAADRLIGPAAAEFPFVDLGERATLDAAVQRRPPAVVDFRSGAARARNARARLSGAGAIAVAAARQDGRRGDRLQRAALSAPGRAAPARRAQYRSAAGSAKLAAAVIRETLAAGGRACRPLVAREGLSATLIEPALAMLQQRGARVRLEHQLRAFRFGTDRVEALDFGDETIALADGRRRHPRGAALCRRFAGPRPRRADRIPRHRQRAFPHRAAGRISRRSSACSTARCEWLFAFPGRLSVTISAGDRLIDTPREELAKTIWAEVAGVTGLPPELPPWQIVRERRATFAATPAQDAKAARRRDRVAQSRAGRRLDQYRLARHHRRRDPLRQPRRRTHRAVAKINANERCDPDERNRSRPAYRGGDAGAARSPARRRPFAVRARSGRHHPGRIRAAAPLSRRAGRCRAGSQHRRLSAPHSGRAWRLAAVPRRRIST